MARRARRAGGRRPAGGLDPHPRHSDVSPEEAEETPSNGRVVLVTGGSRGIGLACARWFLAHGDRVAVTSRSGSVDIGPI
ncbi:MAG: SDR family NAD(P)-dependent oxidoreductase, partial [Acidimicrobiales bacterium]